MMPDAIFNIRALIIKVKSPRVRILIGRVRISKIGRNNAFSIPSAAAAKKAEKKPPMWMPSRR
jgi:hypothetical protein